MIQIDAIGSNVERSPSQKNASAVNDLSVPHEGSLEEYETPTAEMLFPPVNQTLPLNLYGVIFYWSIVNLTFNCFFRLHYRLQSRLLCT